MKAFGIKFDDLTVKEVLEKIEQFLKSDKQHYIVLPYSEFVVRAQKDKEFRDILNKADLCLCEGKGLLLMLKLLGKKLKENINGIDLIYNLNDKIFLLGAKKEIVKKTKEKLGNRVVGYEHGFQDLDKVIKRINMEKPKILLVNLGSPKQEKWIFKNLKKMPSVKVAIGTGGAFDFISEKVKRAPKFMQKAGLEWLWRLIVDPKRIRRIGVGVLGLLALTLKEKLKN